MKYEDLPKSIQEELFKRHTHAEIANDTNPSQIVYREQDVIDLLEYFIVKWIDVKDRFPDPNQIVLCYGKGGRQFTALFQLGEFLYWNEGEFDVAEEVTHWQPTPPNP